MKDENDQRDRAREQQEHSHGALRSVIFWNSVVIVVVGERLGFHGNG